MATQHVRGQGMVVSGLPELQRAFKAANADLAKDLRNELKDIARLVIARAQARGAPSGILRPSVQARAVGVSFPKGGPGNADDPLGFYPWIDFGGGAVPGRGVRARARVASRTAWGTRTTVGVGDTRRAFLKEGRYLYPAIGESTGEIGEAAYSAVERACERNGLKVEG